MTDAILSARAELHDRQLNESQVSHHGHHNENASRKRYDALQSEKDVPAMFLQVLIVALEVPL